MSADLRIQTPDALTSFATLRTKWQPPLTECGSFGIVHAQERRSRPQKFMACPNIEPSKVVRPTDSIALDKPRCGQQLGLGMILSEGHNLPLHRGRKVDSLYR